MNWLVFLDNNLDAGEAFQGEEKNGESRVSIASRRPKGACAWAGSLVSSEDASFQELIAHVVLRDER